MYCYEYKSQTNLWFKPQEINLAQIKYVRNILISNSNLFIKQQGAHINYQNITIIQDKTMQKTKIQPKPIQLIRFDESKNIHLTPEAIDIFNNKLNSQQLCVVCVAGKYRTGKSYILNKVLLSRNHGFEVGPTINACTKGLWMWPEIVKISVNGSVKQCIVIDTEGLGSLEEGQNTDLKIFLMAMLLSSYLIYNSVGSIDQKALQSLNLVINMAQLLQKSSDKFDSQQLINSFPSFMWLVRDFSLKLEDEHGQTISSQQYLQNALKTQNGKSAAAEKKNQVRRQLKRFFTHRDCFTLIRPTLNQKDLQNLSTLQQKKLRPQFIELIKQLRTRINTSIPLKKIRGKPITPQGFIELCNYYITNINSGKLPSLNSHWDNLCISQSGRLVKKYETRLKEFVDERLDRGIETNEFQLKQFGDKMLGQAIQTVEKSFLGKLEKKLLKEKLALKLNQKLGELFDLQFKNQEQLLQTEVKQLFEANQNGQQTFLFQQQESKQGMNDQQSYNFYHKIDLMKDTINKFSIIMRRHIDSKKYHKNNWKFMHKIYEYCFEQLNEKFFREIEEEFYQITSEHINTKTKIKQIEEQVTLNIEQDKKCVNSLRNLLEESERKLTKTTMLNDKLQSQVESLKQSNQSLLFQIQNYKNTIHQQKLRSHETRETLKLKQLRQQELNKKLKQLQVTLADQRIKMQSLNLEMKQFEIRERKMNRECDIYKQKIMQKQQEVDEGVKEVEQLKCQVALLEREKRKMLRNASNKVTSKNQSNQTNSQPTNIHTQQPPPPLIGLQSPIITTIIDQSQQLQPLLVQLTTIQQHNQQLHQSNKQLTKQLYEQQTINDFLVKTPQAVNYQSMKRNYEMERQTCQQLHKKVNDIQNALNFIDRVECDSCGEWIGKQLMISSDPLPHWLKCLTAKTKSIDFDVSYIYNADAQINFLFDIQLQSHPQNPSFCISEECPKSIQWSLLKSLKSIRLFLKHLHKPTQQTLLFNKSLQSSKMLQTSEQSINLNEQRRLYLDELCLSIKSQIFNNNHLIEFFGIDLHVLRNKKFLKKERSFVRKRKVLNLELGQIIEEDTERETVLRPCNKVLYESVNLMKTSKFSLKKVFKFGPNI